MITELRARPARTYAVLGRFPDDRTRGGLLDAVWNGRTVTVENAGPPGNQRSHSPYALADTHEDALARAWAAGALAQRMIGDARRRASEPHPGRNVRSLATRGKNKGLTGTVRMVRVNHHNTRRTALELVVDLHGSDEQRVWDIELTRCIDADPVVYTTQISNQAAHQAATLSWQSLARLLDLRDT